MIVVPPINITDTRLVSSTLPELPPTTYSPVVLYAFQQRCSVALTLGKFAVYESAQPNNYGNATTNPFWWTFIGYAYEAYSSGVSYPLGHVVTDPVKHLLYESLANPNLGNPLFNEAKWAVSGATNKFAMFDNLRDTLTVAQKTLTVVLAPGKRIDSLVLLKMYGITSVTVNMSVGTNSIYSKVIELPERSVSSWLSWLYGEVRYRKTAALFDLPFSAIAVTTLTLTGPDEISIGACIVGRSQFIGRVQYGAVSDASNYSTITRRFDGSVNILTQRRNAPKTINTLWIPKALVGDVFDLRENNGGTPLLWAGIDQTEDDYFRPLLILGFFTSFEINLEYHNDVKVSLTIEEI